MSLDGEVVVDHIWKRFRADRSRALLKDHLSRSREWFRRSPSDSWRYALRDVSFQVSPGESIALVGSNGSGKSTLLKVLSRVMYPYAGRVDAGGRVAAMIEVSSGIHPDLTGRENIQLYGTILGLSRQRIAEQFDAIVEFAGLEQALDRQVKFYSSGMKARLGFGVNAFLEPDVLIVDEVLAVGDGAFQRRCLERMSTVVANGTTLIYVSHDLQTVEAMCRRAIWLSDGVIRADGPTREVLPIYRTALASGAGTAIHGDGSVTLAPVEAHGPADGGIVSGGGARLELTIDSTHRQGARIALGVSEGGPSPIFIVQHEFELAAGRQLVTVELKSLPLAAGEFSVWVSIESTAGVELRSWGQAGWMKVSGPTLETAPVGIVRPSPIYIDSTWNRE